jgi:transcriptional regulator with XRE-family HTH domain
MSTKKGEINGSIMTDKHQNEDQSHRREVGRRLKEAREFLSLHQEDVAQSLGITRTAIVKMENGSRKVDAVELSRLAALYQQPVAVLAGHTEAEPLPEDVMALARTAFTLSEKDRAAVVKFASFLSGDTPED